MRTLTLLLFGLALTAQPAAAATDPYADVSTMRSAFTHVRSVVAVERFSTGQTATVEFASPNRYHIVMPRSQIILAGNVEYARANGGSWRRAPHGAEHQALLQASWQLAGPPNIDIHRLFTITALGTRTIDNAPVRGYLLHDANGAYTETIWINANNLPAAARIEMPTETVDIHYINYNASVLIAKP